MSINKEVEEKIKKLAEKYSTTGQDLPSFLEGLLYADYLSYWDYIHLDTLLTLQTPKTDFPDENIFIIYHQITELYFKLIINELEQISNNGKKIKQNGEDLGWNTKITFSFFKSRIVRVNNYFENLINSFEIMTNGMDRNEFTKFRMSLLPGSGFQSVQFRIIELYATPVKNLLSKTNNKKQGIQNIYWTKGATDLKSGKKTYTLSQFQKKYNKQLSELVENLNGKTIWCKFKELKLTKEKQNELHELLKEFDHNVNVKWKLSHLKSAIKHLKNKGIIKATGGTNWEEYLPPRFQKIIFYPEIWSKQEKKEWGKSWLKKQLNE